MLFRKENENSQLKSKLESEQNLVAPRQKEQKKIEKERQVSYSSGEKEREELSRNTDAVKMSIASDSATLVQCQVYR